MLNCMENDTKILLGVKHYKVEEVTKDKERVVVKVIVGVEETKCPCCGSVRLIKYKPKSCFKLDFAGYLGTLSYSCQRISWFNAVPYGIHFGDNILELVS